jgi:alkanesulfonate monooxygenase SsuD/methylene tetrahydromethanopterin reductase-like flavin-dependent oxidoreductase (luciferase family)
MRRRTRCSRRRSNAVAHRRGGIDRNKSVWFNEEHFQELLHTAGGRTSPSPVIMAAAVAQATTTIRIGFSALLLPLHHPLRLAEESRRSM